MALDGACDVVTITNGEGGYKYAVLAQRLYGRPLTDDEGENAHGADWNMSWKTDQVDDDADLYREEGEDLSCDDIKTRCDYLMERLETNDDITMRIRGRTGKGSDAWGHRVPVESAAFSEGPPCCCEITITKTSIQDGSANDFENIPFSPGTATYSICRSESGATTVTNTEFPGSVITWLAFDSFDEEPRRDGVQSNDPGKPGSALTEPVQ